ncbi:hypothetical protein CRG98_026012 [Punica granatum]|uniref:Uncharacterized protein n=1 Tax=Punica granatum TaxID=22663 RepID=A0A2I0JBC9_PUNGR|nr:hypothetical protein CRG98_026012 [Punica granatum]
MPLPTETASPFDIIVRALQWSVYCLVGLLSCGILFVQLQGLLSDYNPLKIFDVREEEPQVPCYFIFGDSLADNGNNNYRLTLAKSNYPPYGVDFPEGPTGRFTNDRLIVDIIGLFYRN